ncbi:hydroxysqualene dehydroxylase HpnE [Dactylosporangium sp. AC04546]|uniref:hydroxysqualene dehydroxylase HpnE n=1 Tax=Dactylosporangium sp. AC04546 TaxID=2862460 RepID=UPI001EDF917B|nr:hydroxysqualene dehydroxylase HpnE [Dactylosporangium sp. AC04546]WVK88825.1 hydroxysqualene dehydroxylase HpnE [Dactylosporangium sp. AC04546]
MTPGPPASGAGRDVCVVGGGLAGITAAVRLADAGNRVTLLERRSELGGATYSFDHGSLVVDTGQHVFLRCYERYRALLDRLGSTGLTQLQPRFSVPILAPGRAPHVLARTRGLPAPAHLLPALAGYSLLDARERWRAINAANALRAVDPDDPGNDGRSFGEWLADHGQGSRAVGRLWDLITVAALNTPAEHASLALAARVFRTGLLERADAGDIGRPLAPLSSLHGRPALRLLTRLGVRVDTGSRVERVEPDATGFRVAIGGTGGRAGRDEVAVDAVVLAVPHAAAARLVPAAASDDRDDWQLLGSAPIVNVHLRYDSVVTRLPFAAAVESPVQWIFDRTPASMSDGQYLVVSISAADDTITVPAARLATTYAAAVARLFPAARSARVLETFVTREPQATFRQAPGTRALRPGAVTRLPGLVLAGAWTDTGWPDTMEGAVRSGHRAADVVLAHLVASNRNLEGTR